MNHTLLISISAASLLLTGNAFANHESSIPYRDQYRDQPPFETSRTIEDTASYEYADVISVEPIIERVEVPVSGKVCWDEEVYHRHPRYRSGVPQIFGSIIGGGGQFCEPTKCVTLTIHIGSARKNVRPVMLHMWQTLYFARYSEEIDSFCP